MRDNKDIRIVFDLDGVIAKNNKGNYKEAGVYDFAVEQINKVYDAGYYVIICTARYGLRQPGSQYQHGYEETIDWLRKHGVEFHELRMGKPAGDMYVDDKACIVKSENGLDDWLNNFWPALEKLNGLDQYAMPIDNSGSDG